MTLGCRTAPWPPFGVHSMSDLGWRWGSLMVSPPPTYCGERRLSPPHPTSRHFREEAFPGQTSTLLF